MSLRALFAKIHLENHDNMRTLAEALAMRRGRVYTDEDHERERARLQERLDAARAAPDHIEDPYP